MMLVSIVIPLKNTEKYVEQAILSVLNQDYQNIEIIVVDDHSTDQSPVIVNRVAYKDSRVKLVSNHGNGISMGFNTGLNLAKGEVLMRCDADDLFPQGRIRKMVNWIEYHSDVDVVCGYMDAIWQDGTPLTVLKDRYSGYEAETPINDDIYNGLVNIINTRCAFRVKALKDIGGCRPFFITSEDVDLMLRLSEKVSIWYAPIHCYTYRLREDSISRTSSDQSRAWYYKQAFLLRDQRRDLGMDSLDRGIAPDEPDEFPATDLIYTPSKKIAQNWTRGGAWRELDQGNHMNALKLMWKSYWFYPSPAMNIEFIRFLLVTLSKAIFITK